MVAELSAALKSLGSAEACQHCVRDALLGDAQCIVKQYWAHQEIHTGS